MDSKKKGILLSALIFAFVFLVFLAGCGGSSGGGSAPPQPSPYLSTITEISAAQKSIEAATGGFVTHNEMTAILPAGVLPSDANLKVSRVLVSNSTQDPSLKDVTQPYVLSTTSSRDPLNLNGSAQIEFSLPGSGFNPSGLELVFWDGTEWLPIPSTYDESRRVVTASVQEILPYGTRIYFDTQGSSATEAVPLQENQDEDGEIIQEFIALKVVDSSTVKKGSSWINSDRFAVCYSREQDKTLAEAVSQYLEHAYSMEVVTMKFRLPGEPAIPMPVKPSGRNWPVYIKVIKGNAVAYAYNTNYIEVSRTQTPGDELSATCHHEYFHLVQYAYTGDSPGWIDEATADAIGYYTNKGIGVNYSTSTATMGHFEASLDYFQALTEGNENYQYDHYSFYSYILGKYGSDKFKNFFETFMLNKTMTLATLDSSSSTNLSKSISGREGLYWDFYRDYFISGSIFNKDKFLNLSWRPSGSPYGINADRAASQGATFVEVNSSTSYTKNFTVQHLSGQTAVFQFAGGTEETLNLRVSVNSTPGTSSGHIQINTFKNVDGVLKPVGTPEEVSDGGQKQVNYTMGYGENVFEVDVVMTNTTLSGNDYKVTVSASIP